MSTTDTRAAFEKRFGPNDSFAWRDENDNYKVASLQSAWEVWQAATEAAKATGTAQTKQSFENIEELVPLPEPYEIDWPTLNGEALGCGVEDRGIRDRYDAAEYGWQNGVDKAIERVPEVIYDANQMREYGQQCAEAARQPTPEVELPEGWKIAPLKMTDEQAKETAYNINRKYKVAGPLSDFLVRQIWEWGIYASPNPPAEAARQPTPVSGMLKVVRGEICYKSEADDQSYGMWCPVTPDYSPACPDGTEFCVALAATAAPVDMKRGEIMAAVARGWCHPENARKEMDVELCVAITQELNAILAATNRSQP